MERSRFMLFIAVLSQVFSVRPVAASEQWLIWIDPNGIVHPNTAPIDADVGQGIYTFTDNIYCDSNGLPGYGIKIEKSHITIDGDAYTLQGPGRDTPSFAGFDLTDVNNIIIRNASIKNFCYGISLSLRAHDNEIYRNTITDCNIGLDLTEMVVDLPDADSNNTFYHNNFIDNEDHVRLSLISAKSSWDSGDYLLGGNFWSDYAGEDANSGFNQDNLGESDGIGDDPCKIDGDIDNTDRFPLINPYLMSVRNIDSGSRHYTIQEAIDDANAGDSIHVLAEAWCAGRYYQQPHYETIDIDRQLRLIGDASGTPLIDGVREQNHVVTITADNVRIEALTIKNAGDGSCGLFLDQSRYCTITGNRIVDNPGYGVRLTNASNYNTIADNYIASDVKGLSTEDSNNTLICRNSIYENTTAGMKINNSNSTKVIDNLLASDCNGIVVEGTSRDTDIRGNRISILGDLNFDGNVDILDMANFAAQWLAAAGDADFDRLGDVDFFDFASFGRHWLEGVNGYGIVARAPADANNTIAANLVASCESGILFEQGTGGSKISENSLVHNTICVRLVDSPNNIVLDNSAKSSDKAVYLTSSSNVTIAGNEFHTNTLGVRSDLNSDNLLITANRIHDNTDEGITLYYGRDCNVTGNFLIANGTGLALNNGVENATVTRNLIKLNTYRGIWVGGTSKDNWIYHNLFINNGDDSAYNAELASSYDNFNCWNNDYLCDINWPSGGNFWSDYTDAHDNNSGLYQDEPNSDYGRCSAYGIADNNYPIGPNNVDEYPLVLAESKLKTDPLSPKMGSSYVLDVNLTNTAGEFAAEMIEPLGDANLYFCGVQQVRAQPSSHSKWDLWDAPEPDLKQWSPAPPGSPNYPYPLEPGEPTQFQPKFKNTWNWIKADDFAFQIGDLLSCINNKFVAWPIYRFIDACYIAGMAVPEITYTFEPIIDANADPTASDLIVFSKEVTVEVPLGKKLCLYGSLTKQAASIALTIASYWAGPVAGPVMSAAALGLTIAAHVEYNVAVDPDPNYTELVRPVAIPIPDDVNSLDEGPAKRLALTALDVASFEMAYGESYIRYAYARTADPCNEPNEHYMALQLDAAIKYHTMAAKKLQQMQSLTALLIPDMNPLTEQDVNDTIHDIATNGLPPHLYDVFDQTGMGSYEPNFVEIFQRLDANATSEQRGMFTNPEDLSVYGQSIAQNNYMENYALQAAAEADNLKENITTLYSTDVAIASVLPSSTRVSRGDTIEINVELENHGTTAATVDVNVNVGPISLQGQTGTLAPGEKKLLTVNWDTMDLPLGYYVIDANAILQDVNDAFPADNNYTGRVIEIWSPYPADTQSPTTPVTFNANSTGMTVLLSWTASTDNTAVAGYKVYRDGAAIWKGWIAGQILIFHDSNLPPGTYNYQVSAYDLSGNESTLTASHSVTLP